MVTEIKLPNSNPFVISHTFWGPDIDFAKKRAACLRKGLLALRTKRTIKLGPYTISYSDTNMVYGPETF